jgi:hypothetical protein
LLLGRDPQVVGGLGLRFPGEPQLVHLSSFGSGRLGLILAGAQQIAGRHGLMLPGPREPLGITGGPAHLAQLTGHGMPLEEGGAELKQRRNNEAAGQDRHHARPTYEVAVEIVAALLAFAAGWAAAAAAVWSAAFWCDRRWWWAVSAGGLITSAGCAAGCLWTVTGLYSIS